MSLVKTSWVAPEEGSTVGELIAIAATHNQLDAVIELTQLARVKGLDRKTNLFASNGDIIQESDILRLKAEAVY